MDRVMLDAGPDAYIESIGVQANAKSLSQDHRLLHVFYEEIRSASPNRYVGNGWTAETIELAHEAVVKRIKLLDRTYEHDSPLRVEAQASIAGGIVPLLVRPSYVSVCSMGGGAVAVSVDDTDAQEELSRRVGVAFGEDATFVDGVQNDLMVRGKTDYHLVLLPDRLWRQLQVREKPLAAGMDEFRASLGRTARDPMFRGSIIRAAGHIRNETRWKGTEEARAVGREYAARVIAGERIPGFGEELLAGAKVDWEKVREEAEEQFENLVRPVSDGEAFRRSLHRIWEQVGEWAKKSTFKEMDDAMDAARELALAEAQSVA